MLTELDHWDDAITAEGTLIGVDENAGLTLRITHDLDGTEDLQYRVLLIAAPDRGGTAVQVDRTYEGEEAARELLRDWASRNDPLDPATLSLRVE